ncbi:sensor histidine kinase [Alteromonas sp. HB246098]
MDISVTAHKQMKMGIEHASACITWLVISCSALYFLINQFSLVHWRTLSAAIIFITLAICFTVISKHRMNNSSSLYILGFMYFIAVVSQLVVPYVYLAIFVVMCCAILPYYMPWKQCVTLSIPISLPTVIIQSEVWNEQYALLTGALFWTFNVFAMIMSNTAIKESKAREEADALNRQLLSTQQLMKQALTQDERLRIARNIHDVLGHHLTALTINLQVASRKADLLESSESQAIKQHVEQSHSIAKLLLSDVREAISDIRENAAIDFSLAVNALIKDLPRPAVNLHIDDNLTLTNVRIADCLLRNMQEALTNVVRHTQAHYFSISLTHHNGAYKLLMQDSMVPHTADKKLSDEQPSSIKLFDKASCSHVERIQKEAGPSGSDTSSHVVAGNGLSGMQERVHELNGTISWQQTEQGFRIAIHIPEGE